MFYIDLPPDPGPQWKAENDRAAEEMKIMVDSLNKQVGGDHYLQLKISPWELIDADGLNFYEGNIAKYLLRRKGNRIEDLRKIIHYAEHLIALEEKLL